MNFTLRGRKRCLEHGESGQLGPDRTGLRGPGGAGFYPEDAGEDLMGFKLESAQYDLGF